MHRRAHGGAWGAVALLIGSCSLVQAAEPPRLPTKYSSGTQSGNAHLSGVSTFSAASDRAPISTPSSIGQMIEIIPTPIVPSASALSQRGQQFLPTTIVAHVPHAPQVLPPATIGLTPTDLSGANVQGNAMPKVTVVGPLVPVTLSDEEKALLEKALRGVTPSNSTPNAPEGKPKSDAVKPKLDAPKAPVVEKKVSATADEIGDDAQAAIDAETAATKPDPVKTSGAKNVAANRTTVASEKADAAAESAKIVPLPPLEREVPSRFSMPHNLPQPPIPLEFPRTGT